MKRFAKPLFLSLILIFSANKSTEAQLKRELNQKEVLTLTQNIQKNPQNIRARLFLSHHYFSKKQWAKVIETLRPVTEKIKGINLIELGTSYLELKRLHEAETVASMILGEEKVPLENYAFSIRVFDTILSDPEISIQKIEIKNKLFNTLKAAQGAYPKEIAVYDLWLEQLEKHVEHYSADGLRVIEDLKKNEVTLPPVYYSHICRYNYLADFTKEASITCQQALVMDSKNPSNLIYLGKTQIMTGDEENGKRTLASVGEKFADSEVALWETGNSYYESKNLGAAFKYYKKAADHPQAQPRNFLSLAKTAFELKKYQISLKAFIEHCRRSDFLDQEFRRASGLLVNEPKWHKKFRQSMMDCKADK